MLPLIQKDIVERCEEFAKNVLHSNIYAETHRPEIVRLGVEKKCVFVMHPEDAELYACPSRFAESSELRPLLEPDPEDLRKVQAGEGAFILRGQRFVFVPKK